uniref:Protein ELYS n=1 Tax=Melanaphis sacchari TaxID=742174 RepID=A0A2H8TLJ2_9HEMI
MFSRMDFGDLQLYLIDVVITNETNGYKSIELCQHECVKETKSLYPPSNVQSLLMVYLNTELLNTVKDFIIAYFLIDACYLQNLNETTTNLLRNVSYKNERLYKLCNASWFLDHDMFEDAMLIFASYNEWLIDDESWNWFHWSVMKLLVFKEQYYWAQYYLNLFKIKLISLDDHKFYVNLLIRNRNCFDALCYMHSRDMNEKNILFENIFEQCRNTNQLQRILNYPLDENEKVLFVSCLQKFDDTKSIHLKFLLQEQRYSEALEIHKSIAKTKNVCITTGLMNTFTNIPPINRRELNKKIYSDEETTKFWFMMGTNLINFKNTTPIRKNNKSFQINLIIPDVKYKDENIDKLEESDVILGEATDEMNLGELNITLRSEEHLQKLDYVTLDETTDKNNSVKPVILNENEKKLDEHNFAILNKAADENNSLGSLILHESGKKLYEPDFVIVNEATDKNNSDKSDIAHDCEYKENLEEPNVIFSDGSEQSRGKLVSLIKNRKIENDNRVDLHNVKYLRDWLFNTLENPTPYFNSLTEEHHSNDNNQMWDGENENTLGNVIDDDKTSFIIKEDCCVTKALEENTAENSNIPFYFEEDIENCKDDLCDDPNKDYHDDEYTLFNNIFL